LAPAHMQFLFRTSALLLVWVGFCLSSCLVF